MPPKIQTWLNKRGISDEIIAKNKLFWDSHAIGIPIFDKDGNVLFNKYRRDPEYEHGPKYWYDKGGQQALYGIHNLKDAVEVIICEGELDALLLQSNGFCAVTSTGGSQSFKKEWCDELLGRTIYVCFDNDLAGKQGTARIAQMIPDIKIIPLPEMIDMLPIKDITDFFKVVNKENFKFLINFAWTPDPSPSKSKLPKRKKTNINDPNLLRAAKEYPLTNFIQVNKSGFAHCPFHAEKAPSFKIYPNNTWYCFGGCGAGGDTIDFIMRLENLNFVEALQRLAGNT